ncbi:MAG: DUF58 domain-containing protein [Planctomycetes bacterium]|nr:DUF58 domain-containing protein [Planctomycetota bacterium]
MSRVPLPAPRLLLCAALLAGLALALPLAPALRGPWWGLALLLGGLVLVEAAARPPRGAVGARREAAPADHVGRRGAWRVVVESSAGRALRVRVRDVPPAGLEGEGVRADLDLAPGAQVTLEAPFRALARGPHDLLPLGLRVRGPLGLLEWQALEPAPARVVVLPGRPAGETQWLLARVAAEEECGPHPHARRGADWEFDHLREWVPGDELRRVAWTATARRRVPIVRELKQERRSDLLLVLDGGRLMGSLVTGVTKLDLALTPLLDLAAVALSRGERVGLLAFDVQPRAYLPPRAGTAQLQALRDALGRLPSPTEPTSWPRAAAHLEARQRKRSLLVAFSDFTDEVSAAEVERHVAALAHRHALVFVAVGDPHLEAVLTTPDAGPRAAFQQAVAGQLLVERRRVLRRLERLGVPTVDGEPRRLTGPVLGRYLERRRVGVG